MQFQVEHFTIDKRTASGEETVAFEIEKSSEDSFDDNRLGMEWEDHVDLINTLIRLHARKAFDAGAKWARENPSEPASSA